MSLRHCAARVLKNSFQYTVHADASPTETRKWAASLSSFDPNDRRVPVLTTPGVIGIVGTGKVPIPIAEEEIGAVRCILRSGLFCASVAISPRRVYDLHPTWSATGLEGIITKAKKG